MYSAIPLAAGVAFIAFGLIVVFLSVRVWTQDEVSHRLKDFVVEPTAQTPKATQTSAIRRNELAGNFRTRVLIPSIKRVGDFFGRLMPSRNMDSLNKQLAIAGNPLGLGARQFYGIRMVLLIMSILAAFYALRQGLTLPNLLMAVLALYLGAFLPTMWLKRQVRRRQDRVRKDMPDALDMLSVCAQAGLGFDQSLQRVSEYWKTALATEFGRVVAEMEMGVPRRQALRNLADRWSISELSSFVAVIIQSDQLGMSIADTLQAQAQQMRVERRFRAQEAARKVPLKMLFPMILLIFPAMLAVTCGPSIPILVNFFSMLGGG